MDIVEKVFDKLMENKKIAGLGLVGLLLLMYGGIWGLGIMNPSFEGAKCFFYGSDFRFNSDWQGTYQIHRYQDAEPWLVKGTASTYWDTISWVGSATPNDANIGWKHEIALSGTKAYPDLGIHVESNIQLSDVNRQGDPIGWNISDPSSGRRIEYWSKTATLEETADKVIYHWSLNKESFIVVPAEFWVGFYLVPAQTDAGTRSGWREGEWQQITCWFMLDWATWDNAYRDSWLDDPQLNVFDSAYNGSVLNQQKTDEYRGGFPITAWIQGWEKAGYTSTGPGEDPIWLEARGDGKGTFTSDQFSSNPTLKDALMSKVQFAPSLVGSFLSLYNEPSAQFGYDAQTYQGGYQNDNAYLGYVKTPDTRMKKVMYFPINILNFGTHSTGYELPWSAGTLYYPSCYFRVRILYGVYGTFTYLWTEELAKDPTVNYPDEIERHGTYVINTPGIGNWFSGLTDWLSNPFNQMWVLFFSVLIVVAIVSIASPGLWTVLARRGKPT